MSGGVHEFCNGVVLFVWDRLPLDKSASIDGRQPCLEEDWFVEDALAADSPFVWRGRSPEESHRLLYRYARLDNFERGFTFPHPERLLLHQMVELIPLLCGVAVPGALS